MLHVVLKCIYRDLFQMSELLTINGGGLSKFLKVNGKRTSTAYSFFLGGLSKFLKVNGKKTSIAYSYFLGGLSKFLKVNGKRTSIACSYLLYFGRCGVMGPQACVTVPVLHLSKHMKQVSSDPKMAPALLQLCTSHCATPLIWPI